jgi:hypothetical protein
MQRNDKYYTHLCRVAGIICYRNGPAAAVRALGVTRKFAEYWRDKLVVPGFHNGTVGGARNVKFDDSDRKDVEALLFSEVKRQPQKNCQQFANSLTNQGYNVDRR